MSTAKIIFHDVAAIVRAGLQPEGRAEATAATLEQVGDIAGDLPLTLADLYHGFARLAASPGIDERGSIAGRRRTVGEIAALIGGKAGGTTASASPERLAAALDAVVAALAAAEDPRQRAMAATAAREAAELRG